MIHLLKTVIAVILAVLLTLGAVYNRTLVEISLGPVLDPISLPLYLIVYCGLLLGFLLGIFYGWFRYGPIGQWSKSRRKKKKQRKDQDPSTQAPETLSAGEEHADEANPGSEPEQKARDLTMSGWEKP